MIEYKVIRAPEGPGKSILGRAKASYAEALGQVLNEQGLEDWVYLRSEPGPDRHPLLIFSRSVKKLEDDLPGITLLGEHQPPEERTAKRPRRARELMDEDRAAIERIRAGRRRITVDKTAAADGAGDEAPSNILSDSEEAPKSNVADMLAAKIAKAQADKLNDS